MADQHPSPSNLDHTACQAAHDAMYEAAIEAMENPGLMSSRDYFEYRLGTAGHLYHREGLEAIMRERDQARADLDNIAEQNARNMAERARWTRAFNRLEKAVTNHIEQRCIDSDDLVHVHKALMRDLGPEASR